ncbi:hypothetical protein FNV43_RR08252 [Rhamnella rubrinervis]|uniref:Uncharacterized protein n=1 Tax=Rhamnella rubrinervis TaxID=2594499 RepID=A0A8K0HHA5_9ROSA|nr:hypothetical protein FNV43_RR08252 [Rhamnella rubrinervis]
MLKTWWGEPPLENSQFWPAGERSSTGPLSSYGPLKKETLTLPQAGRLNHINYPTTAGFDVLEEERGFSKAFFCRTERRQFRFYPLCTYCKDLLSFTLFLHSGKNEFNELSEVNEFEFIFQEVKGLFGSVNWGVEFLFQAEQQEVNSAFPPSFCLFSSPMASRIPRYLVNQSSPIPTGSRYYVLEVELVEEGGVRTSQDDAMGEANSRGLA